MTGFDWLILALGVLGMVAPHWVPKMGPVWRNAITVLGLILLAYSSGVILEEVTGMKLQTGPFIGIIVGLLIIAGSITWHIQMSKAQTPPSRPLVSTPQQQTMPPYAALEQHMTEALADPRYSAETKFTIQHQKDVLPFKYEYRLIHGNVSLAELKSPEAVAFFNKRLRETGKNWQITSENIDLTFGNMMLDSSMSGPFTTGIKIQGGGGNTFDQTDIKGAQTGVDLENTKKNQFRARTHKSRPLAFAG